MALVSASATTSVVYCQFCKNVFPTSRFTAHLSSCNNYIKYAYAKRKHRLALPTNITVSVQTQPEVFFSLLPKKRVILVGPSITTQDCNLGSFIDSFDVVIRMNKNIPIPSSMYKHIGTRTDILYNSCNTSDFPGENKLDPHLFLKCGIKAVRCPVPPVAPFASDMVAFQARNQKRISFSHIDPLFYQCLLSNLKTRPYTGTCAIAELLRFDIKELYVVGIDFYTYGYARFYRQVSDRDVAHLRNNHIHQREPQIDLVKRFYLLDERLVVDQVLDKILLEHYDTFFHQLQTQFSLSTLLITANHHYIGQKHSILKLLEPSKKKKKVCLLGNNSSVSLREYDFVIDLAPFRKEAIVSNLVILPSSSQFVPAHYEPNQSVLLLQPYHKDIQHESTFPLKNLFYLHPHFLQQLELTIRKHILPHGNMNPQLFVMLFFSLYLEKSCQLFVSGTETFSSWHQQDKSKIYQRLIYKYLLKRGFLTFLDNK